MNKFKTLAALSLAIVLGLTGCGGDGGEQSSGAVSSGGAE